jgi:septal ring factor EnvC (AmiA/AmiB activator)
MCTIDQHLIHHINKDNEYIVYCKNRKKGKNLKKFKINFKKENVDSIINKINQEITKKEDQLNKKIKIHKQLFDDGESGTIEHTQNKKKIIAIIERIEQLKMSINNLNTNKKKFRYFANIENYK